MSVQGLDVNMATSSGAQWGGVDTLVFARTGVAEKFSLYKKKTNTMHLIVILILALPM